MIQGDHSPGRSRPRELMISPEYAGARGPRRRESRGLNAIEIRPPDPPARCPPPRSDEPLFGSLGGSGGGGVSEREGKASARVAEAATGQLSGSQRCAPPPSSCPGRDLSTHHHLAAQNLFGPGCMRPQEPPGPSGPGWGPRPRQDRQTAGRHGDSAAVRPPCSDAFRFDRRRAAGRTPGTVALRSKLTIGLPHQ